MLAKSVLRRLPTWLQYGLVDSTRACLRRVSESLEPIYALCSSLIKDVCSTWETGAGLAVSTFDFGWYGYLLCCGKLDEYRTGLSSAGDPSRFFPN